MCAGLRGPQTSPCTTLVSALAASNLFIRSGKYGHQYCDLRFYKLSALNLNVTQFFHPMNIFLCTHLPFHFTHTYTPTPLVSDCTHTSCMLLSVSFCSLSVPALLTFHQQRVLEIDFNFQHLFWGFSPTNSR